MLCLIPGVGFCLVSPLHYLPVHVPFFFLSCYFPFFSCKLSSLLGCVGSALKFCAYYPVRFTRMAKPLHSICDVYLCAVICDQSRYL